MARTYGKFSDLITFTRASGGTALRPVGYGSELVTNGDGSSTSNWTTEYGNSTLSVSSGSLRTTADATGAYDVTQSFSAKVGTLYRLEATIDMDNASGGAGNLRVASGSNLPPSSTIVQETTTGSSVRFFKATASTMYVGLIDTATAVGDYMEFSNISIKEVLFDQPNAPLTLFNHPVDIPRIEYDADGNRLGLLIEEARTNRVPASNDWGNGTYWSTIRTTFTANQAVSPDGSVNAAALTEDTTASSTHLGLSSSNITVVDAAIYTSSIFVKANTRSWVQLQEGQGVTASAYFNLATGEIGTVSGTGSPSASIQDVGNGWYRCSLTFTSLGTAARIRLYLATGSGGATYTGDGTSGVFLWGAQLEEGAFPTSYIPTSGSTATRAADSASIPVSEFGYNDDEGTVFIEISDINGGVVAALGDGTFTNDLRFGVNGSNIARGSGAGFVNSVLSGAYSGETGKLSIGIEKDNYYTAKNGTGSGVADTSASLPPNPEKILIGRDYGNYLNGHIKSIKYYPRRLTNAQLQELTS